MQIATAKYIFDGTLLLKNTSVLFKDNIVVDLLSNDQLSEVQQTQIVNYGDGVICAGFIDLQLNGCGGVLFNDNISTDALEIMYQTCVKFGTTSFLPTLITCDFSDVILALETIKTWFDKYGDNRGVIGIHLEGPFISGIKKGIHPEQYILKPNDKLLYEIVKYAQYFSIKMTVAVEEFTLQQLQWLTQNEVILAVGHSVATYDQVIEATKVGVTCATHTFNAMTGLTARDSGVIGAILNNENIYAGIIADLLHVDAENVQLLHKLKHANKMYLVTDSVTSTGTDIKEFMLGGKKINVIDGKCIDENGTIGGANLTIPDAIKNCVKYCRINLEDALIMASKTPSKIMHFDNKLGAIKAGYRANLVYLDLNEYATTTISVCR